jgi:flavin reductase (DIM6/NTAB) family NADH-FMN oxidoreductase RutF
MSSPQIFSLIGADAYRELCSQLVNGVAVATVTAPDGKPHGLTVSSFTPVSIEPPLVLVCIDFRSTAVDHFRQEPFFAINVLTEEQRELSVSFAEKPEGRFEDIDWRPGQTGAPVLSGSLAIIECRRDRVIEVGDHAIIIGHIVAGETHPGKPLVYFNRTYRSLR